MKRAFFWIANQRYIFEAINSAERVHKLMPNEHKILFTPSLPGSGLPHYLKPVHVTHVDDEFWFYQSVCYFLEAFEWLKENEYLKVIYMDTDTTLIDPIPEIFDMLNFYHVLGTHAPARYTRPNCLITKDIPLAFPELNIGLLALAVTPAVSDMVKWWKNTYKSNKKDIGNNDQVALRATLWWMVKNKNISLHILPSEYNFRFNFGGFVGRRVKVLHGRSKDIEGTIRKVNEDEGSMRTWQRGALD
jgi:hypothetical protein